MDGPECGHNPAENGNAPNAQLPLLPIAAIAVSSVGIIGYWAFYVLTQQLQKSVSLGYSTEDVETLINTFRSYTIILSCFSSLVFIDILIALIAQYKNKSLFALIIGLTLCVYVIALPFIQMVIQMAFI